MHDPGVLEDCLARFGGLSVVVFNEFGKWCMLDPKKLKIFG